MKKLTLIWILFVAISCSQSTENQNNAVSVISPETFQQKLSDTPEAILIDVRTPEECSEGIVENAQQIDYKASDFDEKITALDKTKPVFLYCRSGGRSGRTASMLQNAGFTQIYDLEGGMMAWKNKGLKTVNP